MIQFKDALLLARLKYKTYMARSIGTTIVVGIGVIAFGMMLFSVSGMTSVVRQVFRDNVYGRYMVNLEIYPDCSYVMDPDANSTEIDTCEIKELDIKAFKRQFARFDLSRMEEHKMADYTYALNIDSVAEHNLAGKEFPIDIDSNLKTANALLLNEYLYDGYTLDEPTDGAIPVIISDNFLSNNFTVQFDDFEANYQFYQKLSKDWVGKTITLDKARSSADLMNESYGNEIKPMTTRTETDLEIIIVGILPTRNVSLFGFSYLGNGIYVPKWATTANDGWKTAFKNASVYNYMIEVDSKEDRDDLIVKYYAGTYSQGLNGYISPVMSVFESFQQMIKAIRIVVFVISGFILGLSALFIFATVSKFTSEGKKEIAVFRSYGAQKGDIRKIFNFYIMYVVNIAIAAGLVISLIACIILSLNYNDKIFYALVSAGTTIMVEPPALILVGFDVVGILLLVVGVNLVGFLAGAFPIWRATKIDPIVALRDE